MKKVIFLFCFFALTSVFSQESGLKGVIKLQDGTSAIGVSVIAQSSTLKRGISTSSQGEYELKLPSGSYKLQISGLGLQTISEEIKIPENQIVIKNFTIKEDLLGLDEVVVTGVQQALPFSVTPVAVSKISGRVFEATQSLSLSEGLNFTPGLRTETNCQNCGFNQLRINGLDGAYSQILINGRAIFSALTGVYALEMFPANMIERIEVVKGSGSVLYGGNAVAGSVNILTKDPIENAFSFGNNLSLIDFKTPDNTFFANTSVVSDRLDKGLTLFAYQRNRGSYDANGDEFSELTKLKNTTFGADAFWLTSERSKIKFNFNTINEFRRGGNKFDLQPHESDITEQLKHRIYGGNLSFEQASADFKHKFSLYASGQYTLRDSYYGGGLGRKITEDDFSTLTPSEQETFFSAINSYGYSQGFVGVFGGQYNYVINDNWGLALGSEHKHDYVDDKAAGRSILQKVKTFGNYAQLEYKPIEKLTFLAGTRYDYVLVNGDYTFRDVLQKADKKFSVWVPRLTAMYDVTNKIKIRGAYSQGYRAPQAFDETLHTDVIGGDVIFIEFNKDLKAERSDSFTASFNYTSREGKNQTNLILEGFLTKIKNAFYHNDIKEDPATGIQYKEMINSEGFLNVMGINAEANFAFGNKIVWQSGLTIQNSEYSVAQPLFDSKLYTKKVLRTPDIYGFTNFSYQINPNIKLSYSGVFTGSMLVPHQNEEVIKKSPIFFEQNIKTSYDFNLKDNYKVEVSAGVQNIFNNYQKDFDRGSDRDPNYIYGPQRPRTLFFGISFKK